MYSVSPHTKILGKNSDLIHLYLHNPCCRATPPPMNPEIISSPNVVSPVAHTPAAYPEGCVVRTNDTESDRELQKIVEGIDPRQIGAWRSFDAAPMVVDKPTDSYDDSLELQKKLAATERELLAHHQMLKRMVDYLPPSVHLGYGGRDFYPDGNVRDMGRMVQKALSDHKSMKEAFDFLWSCIGTRLDKGVGSTNYRLISAATVALVNRLTHELNQSVSGEAFLVRQRQEYQDLEQQTAERHLAQCQEIIASKEAMALKLQEAEEKLARLEGGLE